MPRRGARTSRLRRAPGPRLNVPPPGMLSALRRLRPAQLLELATDACEFFLKVFGVALQVPGAPAAPGRERDRLAGRWPVRTNNR